MTDDVVRRYQQVLDGVVRAARPAPGPRTGERDIITRMTGSGGATGADGAEPGADGSGLSVDTVLSDPVLLGPRSRRAAVALMFVILAVAVSGQVLLGWSGRATGVWVPIGLALTALFLIVAILVLVMGYRSVTIKASAHPTG